MNGMDFNAKDGEITNRERFIVKRGPEFFIAFLWV